MKRLHPRHPALGIACALLLATATSAQELPRFQLGIRGQYTPQGMQVQTVTPGSEAARAGLQPGDMILKVDGVMPSNDAALIRVLNSSGGTIALNVRKMNGRTLRLDLNLRADGGVMPLPGDRFPIVGGGRARAPFMLGVTGDYRPEGMLVRVVGEGTPAARAGLQPNDVIVRINNQVIRGQRDLFAALYGSGGTVVLDVRRGAGRVGRVTVDLQVYELGALGDFTPQGLRVRVVAPGTAAERVGLQPGDFIVAIDRQPIRNQNDFQSVVRNSAGFITLAIRRGVGGAPQEVPVELVNNPLGVWCEPGLDGLRITSVTIGSPGDAIGLERGDTILRVDGVRLQSNRDLVDALKTSGGLVSLIVRKGRTDRIVRVDAILGW